LIYIIDMKVFLYNAISKTYLQIWYYIL